jgi:seryl-tRNA synthetase
VLDLKWIRENPRDLDTALAKRRHAPMAEAVLKVDGEWRHLQTLMQEVQNARNLHAKTMGEMRKKGETLSEQLLEEGGLLKEKVAQLESQEKFKEAELKDLLDVLPNILEEDVPAGDGAEDNVCIRQWGEKTQFSFPAQEHWALGEALGQMDFKAGAQLSGARFVVLKSQLAQLERALAQFMLDTHTQTYGYTEISPPYLVRSEILYGTGQLPKFSDESFCVTTKHDPLWLIATAEIPLTNLVAGHILSEEELPLRFVAHTPCFRSEAGAAGKDTRGMIRMHQFHKVELVSITAPQMAKEEHERMTHAAESILQKLDLPYQVVLLCTGDTGAMSQKTYDLEVWLPGQKLYREISSCSRFGDFHARRMGTRYRPAGGEKHKSLPFVHTLNGSGLAVGRTLVAILENYQNADGSITIPPVLRPYMNHKERICPHGL